MPPLTAEIGEKVGGEITPSSAPTADSLIRAGNVGRDIFKLLMANSDKGKSTLEFGNEKCKDCLKKLEP